MCTLTYGFKLQHPKTPTSLLTMSLYTILHPVRLSSTVLITQFTFIQQKISSTNKIIKVSEILEDRSLTKIFTGVSIKTDLQYSISITV